MPPECRSSSNAIAEPRLAAVVDSQSGGRLGVTTGLQTYGHAMEVMDGWAARFVKRLDDIHGYTKR